MTNIEQQAWELADRLHVDGRQYFSVIDDAFIPSETIIASALTAARNQALDDVFNEWMKGHTADSWYNWLCEQRAMKTEVEK